jgi:hypothetical protein
MKYAEVDFWLGAYQATVDVLQAMTVSTTTEGPGLTHAETVQAVSAFAVWRDFSRWGGTAEIAFYKAGSFYYASDSVSESEYVSIMGSNAPVGQRANGNGNGDKQIAALSVWGIGYTDYNRKFTPGEGLPDDWPAQLSLAADWAIDYIENAKQAAARPVAGAERPVQIVLPAAAVTAIIIVAGTAATVIGATAAWRFFDPDARTAMHGIAAANNAFMARIDTFKSTGKMPPPSPAELGAKEVVAKAAGTERKESWTMFAIATGGIVGGTVLGAFINSRMQKAS